MDGTATEVSLAAGDIDGFYPGSILANKDSQQVSICLLVLSQPIPSGLALSTKLGNNK